jgi:acyl-CoA reductase-like NAD-dependent aldehyde dehydrogenase
MSHSKTTNIDFTTFYNIVDGKQRTSKEIHHGINPSTGEELWDVPIASKQDLEDAVAAGKRAFPAWSQTTFEKRREALAKFVELYQAHEEEFTNLLCKEAGKPVSSDALAEALRFHTGVLTQCAEEVCRD